MQGFVSTPFQQHLFVAVFLGYNQYWPGGFMVFVVLCPGAPEGSPTVVLVLKRLRRWGHSLKLKISKILNFGESELITCMPPKY